MWMWIELELTINQGGGLNAVIDEEEEGGG